ncbi:MAG: AI-2E family transporter, partial [Desulfosarcina sp.]
GIFLRKTGAWIAGKIHVGVGWGTLIAVVGLTLAVLASLAFMAPQISDQTERLIDQLPDSWQQVGAMIDRSRFGQWIFQQMPSFQQLSDSIGGLMHKATAWIYSAVGALSSVLIIMILGLYLAFNADLYTAGIRRLVPPQHRRLAEETLNSLGSTLYWWLMGRLLSMLIIAVLTVLGLMLLGVPLALTLGSFAALMAFIPNIGPLVGLIPAILVSLQDGWQLAALVMALYIGIQTVESYLITPMVQRKLIAMPAALILTAQLIMGSIQGALGLLVATPLVAAIMVLIKHLYIEAILGDPIDRSVGKGGQDSGPADSDAHSQQ